MLKLRRVRPLDVDERRIRLDDAVLDQMVQAQQVLVVAQAVQVAAAEGQGAKVLVDAAQQGLCRVDAQGHLGRVDAARVVRRLHVVVDVALARRAKRLDGEDFALFHLGLVAALDDGHRLAAVDLVLVDVVPVEVADRPYLVRLAAQLHFVALHDFLDCGANVGHAHVDAGFLLGVSG